MRLCIRLYGWWTLDPPPFNILLLLLHHHHDLQSIQYGPGTMYYIKSGSPHRLRHPRVNPISPPSRHINWTFNLTSLVWEIPQRIRHIPSSMTAKGGAITTAKIFPSCTFSSDNIMLGDTIVKRLYRGVKLQNWLPRSMALAYSVYCFKNRATIFKWTQIFTRSLQNESTSILSLPPYCPLPPFSSSTSKGWGVLATVSVFHQTAIGASGQATVSYWMFSLRHLSQRRVLTVWPFLWRWW